MSKTEKKPFISIIIPCYNEEKNLAGGTLDKIVRTLNEQSYSREIIIVDDGSSDNSGKLLENFVQNNADCKLINIPHGGKPAAIWAGIQRAEGQIILFMDMDQSTPITELEKLLPWYDEGYDVVIGSRGTAREGSSMIRKIGSFIFGNLRRSVILHTIHDTQCGFKTCRRECAQKVFPGLQYFKQSTKPVGWKVSAYDVELLYLFEKAGCRIREVEVQWQDRDMSTTKHRKGKSVQYLHESIEMAKEVIRIKMDQMKGIYK